MNFISSLILFGMLSSCGVPMSNQEGQTKGVRVGNGAGDCGYYQIVQDPECMVESMEINAHRPILCNFASPLIEQEYLWLKRTNRLLAYLTLKTFDGYSNDRLSIVKISKEGCSN